MVDYNQNILKKEHISIVIDEYGGTSGIITLEDLIEETVQSATAQTYTNIEIIIVDNQSTDNTWAKIQKICNLDNNTIGILMSKNFGQHNAFLLGI